MATKAFPRPAEAAGSGNRAGTHEHVPPPGATRPITRPARTTPGRNPTHPTRCTPRRGTAPTRCTS